MAVDERSRHELYERLVQALGTEAAVTMMEHLPPVGWSDVATKHDLAQLERRLEQRMDMRFAAVDSRFEVLEQRMDARFAAAEQRIDARFELVDQRFETMGQRLAVLENRLLAAFRGEIAAALTSQTRTIIFTMAGSLVTMSGFAIAIARLA